MHLIARRFISSSFPVKHSRLIVKQSRLIVMSNTQSDSGLSAAKIQARQVFKERLKSMTSVNMKEESDKICTSLLTWPPFVHASRIAIYVHCERLREVETTILIQAALGSGKRCYVPVVEDKCSNMKLLQIEELTDLIAVPPFGILEPRPDYKQGGPREDVVKERVALDLVIMPGLAFCPKSGARLGRGGGYYDKLLLRLIDQAKEDARDPPLFLGLAFSSQLSREGEEIPMGDNDFRINALATDQAILNFQDIPRWE